jgi:hypothetical protein
VHPVSGIVPIDRGVPPYEKTPALVFKSRSHQLV